MSLVTHTSLSISPMRCLLQPVFASMGLPLLAYILRSTAICSMNAAHTLTSFKNVCSATGFIAHRIMDTTSASTSPADLPRRSTFQSSHTKNFVKYKAFFYLARVLRELVPAILISAAIFGYVSSLWAARRGDSFVFETTLPMRSPQLDKAAWHFALTKGETNPDCTADDLAKLPRPHDDVAHGRDIATNGTKGFHECYWWQRVAELVVYPRSGVKAGMKNWPSPKWQKGLGSGNSWAEGTDDLWCLAYTVTSPAFVPVQRVSEAELRCGITPPEVMEWSKGWKTSYVLAENLPFPSGDPNWEIMMPNSWPPSRDGLCYSMCLNVAGANNNTPAQQALDILVLFFLPILFDLTLILVWINQKKLYGGWIGNLTTGQRVFCKHERTDRTYSPVQSASLLTLRLFIFVVNLLRPYHIATFLGRCHLNDCLERKLQTQNFDCDSSLARRACLRTDSHPFREFLSHPWRGGFLPSHEEVTYGKTDPTDLLRSWMRRGQCERPNC